MKQIRLKAIQNVINNKALSNEELNLILSPQSAGDIMYEDFYRDAYSMSILVKNFKIDDSFIGEYFKSNLAEIPNNLDDIYHIYSLLLEVKSDIVNQRDRVSNYKYNFMQKLAMEILGRFTSIIKVSDEIITLLGDMIKVLNDAFIYDTRGALIDDWTYDTLRKKYNDITNKSNINDLFVVQNTNPMILPKNYGPIFRKELPSIDRSMRQNLAIRTDENSPKNTLEKTSSINNELSGTLDKVKVIREFENENGVDTWLKKHISTGLVDVNNIELVVEYKYDGVATETSMTGTSIIEARTRGDKSMDQCNDISNLVKYLPFKYSSNSLLKDDLKYGMQFEILMSKPNLINYRNRSGKDYANCRSAITSLVTSINGPQLREFITLAPIRTNLTMFKTRLDELEWIDKNFGVIGTKLPVVINGNLETVLQKIEAIYKDRFESMDEVNFLYDGLVISFNDKELERKLGRINDSNEFSVALKFPNMIKQAKFLGYNLTVGMNGQITPMIKFSDTYFYGNKYTEASGASLGKIQDLKLRDGDIIDIEYVNYVMPAVIGRNERLSEFNNKTPITTLSMVCPSCGLPLVINETGRMLYCTNMLCEGRIIKRASSMVAKLGFENMAKATMEKLKIKSIKDLILLTNQKLLDAGYTDKTALSILEQIKQFKNDTHIDYVLFGSLGIDGLSNKKLKLIFQKVSPRDLLDNPVKELFEEIRVISGIGDILAQRIVDYFKENKELIRDTLLILRIVFTKNKVEDTRKKVVFTNVSSSMKAIVMKKLSKDYVEDDDVTKSTALLVIGTTDGNPSSKEKLANKYGIKTETLLNLL